MRRLNIRPLGLLVVTLMLFALIGVASPAEAAVVRPFTPRFTLNTTGAIVMTGNTMLTCPTSATGCAAARTGTGSTLSANNNNNFSMAFVDIDGDPTTFDSSRNTLTIPATSNVLFAGLYWGADTTAGTTGAAAPNPSARGQVLLRTPATAGYQAINADGTLAYTPDDGFTGTDTFTYTITDGADTANATVTITVTPSLDPVDDDRGPSGPLAFTGSSILLLIVSGSILFFTGLAAVTVARRRSSVT